MQGQGLKYTCIIIYDTLLFATLLWLPLTPEQDSKLCTIPPTVQAVWPLPFLPSSCLPSDCSAHSDHTWYTPAHPAPQGPCTHGVRATWDPPLQVFAWFSSSPYLLYSSYHYLALDYLFVCFRFYCLSLPLKHKHLEGRGLSFHHCNLSIWNIAGTPSVFVD